MLCGTVKITWEISTYIRFTVTAYPIPTQVLLSKLIVVVLVVVVVVFRFDHHLDTDGVDVGDRMLLLRCG